MKSISWRYRLGMWVAASISGIGGWAADATLLGVIKGVAHLQTGPDTVVLKENAHRFEAFADGSAPGRIVAASVTPPSSGAVAMAPDGDEAWGASAGFPNQAGLDTAFPNGTFALRVTGHADGQRDVTLNLAGDTYPPVPKVEGYDQLQAVDPSAPLSLTWQPFAGGLPSDFIQVELSIAGPDDRTVLETGAPGEPGSLDGTRTSVLVPAGTLQAGQSYVGRLFFGRILGFNFEYGPETPAVTGYFRETEFSLRAAGPDTQFPTLAGSSPNEWNGPVPRQSGIAFVFSEPMRPGHAVAWTGLDPSSVTYRWTSDARILYCLPSPALPPDTEIGWRLDPAGFSDLAGNALPGPLEGRFHTAAADPAGVGDIEIVGLYRAEFFIQVPGEGPTRPATGGYAAAVFVDSTGFNTLIEGSVTTPDSETFPLPYAWGDALEIEEEFDSPEELADAAPSGVYQVTVQTARAGTQSVMIQVPDPVFPSIPEIIELEALQQVDATRQTELRWSPFVGGGTGDFIRLKVALDTDQGDDFTVFDTPEFPDPGYLDGTRTSVVIPPGTLDPGREYRIELEFARLAVNDTQTLPGSRIAVAAVRASEAPLITTGILPQPEIRIQSAPPGRFALAVTGPQEMDWQLERAGNPAGPWTVVTRFRAGPVPWGFEEDASRDRSFYRVRQAP